MLPIISGGHTAYQDTFISDFFIYYPSPFVLSKQTWNTIIEFWHLDLSLTDTMMQDYYSKFDPAPRTPSCMLRSYLLSIKLKVTLLKRSICHLFLKVRRFLPHGRWKNLRQ
ncbi:MAG: hypothetical protein ACERKN_21620 [Velocimicrobium sp.]